MHPNKELPADPGLVELRKCTRPVESGDGKTGVCGWMVFDSVVLIADVSQEPDCPGGESFRIQALSCRSCGAILPDGIPDVMAKKLAEV